mgnify:CR=1 FL=1
MKHYKYIVRVHHDNKLIYGAEFTNRLESIQYAIKHAFNLNINTDAFKGLGYTEHTTIAGDYITDITWTIQAINTPL